MIIGIGTDLVEINRIEKVLQRFPQQFPKRLLASSEYTLFQAHGLPARFLAKRFAMKEAILKALGTGLSQGITWHDFIIDRLPIGKPSVNLAGNALKTLQAMLPAGKIAQVHISVSDETHFVVAFVTISAVSEF